jgi:hypothetical protein
MVCVIGTANMQVNGMEHATFARLVEQRLCSYRGLDTVCCGVFKVVDGQVTKLCQRLVHL